MELARPNQSKFIVNIVGLPGVGKTSICGYLRTTRQFEIYSPSDAIRDFASRRGYSLRGRQDYLRCHAEMIAADPDAMIRPALESNALRLCIDGLRAPGPMQTLRTRYGAISIALDCPLEERFRRSVGDKGRAGHRKLPTLEDFRADELPDYHNDDPAMVSMDDMLRLADYHVDATAPPTTVHEIVGAIIDNALR